MPRNRISKEEKLYAVSDILDCNSSIPLTATRLHVHVETVREWVRNYQSMLDLFDRRVVAYEIGDNNNQLVFQNFDHAVELCPDAHPLFHSNRGFQYTNATFHQKLIAAEMTQSMSRVGKCLDNGPMEGF